MKRREFIPLLGSAVLAFPFDVRAQRPAMPVIGFLNSGFADAVVKYVAAFHNGLNETGYVKDQNIAI